MLGALIATAALGVGTQQPALLFPRLFPSPTGTNALEYYVRAADFAKQNDQRIVDMLEVQNSGKSVLEVQESLTRKCAEIVFLVKRGNQYPCAFPKSTERLPVLTAMKEVAKVLYGHSTVLFAHGRSSEATDALLAAMGMADRLSVASQPLSFLVARAVDAIALSAFHNTFTMISLDSASKILGSTKAPEPSKFLDAWTTDSLDFLTVFEPNERTQFSEKWNTFVAEVRKKIGDVLSLPEMKWTEASDSLAPHKLTSDPALLEGISITNPASYVRSFIMWRTQRRLLRVHALIAQARWYSGGRLPATLAELPQEAQIDPTTGVAYAYVVSSSAGYDLYSPGKNYSGDIRLKINAADLPQKDGGL